MGGSRGASRRLELGQDIDQYITGVRKRKPFALRPKKPAGSFWPWSGGSQKQSFSNRIDTPILQPIRPQQQQRLSSASYDGISLWEGLKARVAHTIQEDLQHIDQQPKGGTPMKQDDDFIDFEDGGLKVVPIPEDLETPARSSPKPLPSQSPPPSVMLDPFADDPLPSKSAAKPQKKGWLSGWFGTKKAAKEEAKLDNDFLLQATVSRPAAAIEEDKELKEDFKELSKLFLKSLERMNKEQLTQFKTTDDFNRFKTLLQKHKVIK